jgi:hypothetical protein
VPVRVILIDRLNLFEPLLYQVATAGVSLADIANFNHEEWSDSRRASKKSRTPHSRGHILVAFERAENSTYKRERRRLLTFVLVCGGPTGVEMAGAIAELARGIGDRLPQHRSGIGARRSDRKRAAGARRLSRDTLGRRETRA